jgi:protein O-mannosyl-transferase
MNYTQKLTMMTIVIGLLVYANCLTNPFVFDDLGLIVHNPSVHSLGNVFALFFNHNSSQLVSHYYRPISQILYALIYSLFQAAPLWFHLVQVSLHIISAVLLNRFFKKFFPAKIALFLSIVFLVHPINQFTVAYISSLHDTLYLFFGLLSLLVLPNPIFSGILLLLSLLSKESGIQFLLISLVYIYFFYKKSFIKHLLISTILFMVYLFLRFVSQTPIIKDPLVPIMALPLTHRLIHIPAIVFYYLKTYFFPTRIQAFHSWVIAIPTLSNFFLPLIIDGTLLVLAVLLSKNSKYIFFLIWILIGLGVHSQIIPIDMTVSDHFFYFTQIGLLGLLGLLIINLKYSLTLPALLIIGLLSLVTINRNFVWTSQSRILSHDQAISPPDYLTELLYASDLLTSGQSQQANPHIQTAISLYPQSGRAYNVLGGVYYQQGEIENARNAYLKAISLNHYYAAYENLGLLMIKNDPATPTAAFLSQATTILPASDKLWFYRLIAENKLGNHDQALISAKKYFYLKGDETSKTIYSRLLHNLPVTIDLK